MTDPELISPEVLQLVQLFSAQSELRFPELDAGVLHDAVARVKELHLEVVRIEATLAAAQAALAEEQEALLKKAQRGHAYLRVFAENNEALTTRVEAIALPRPRRAPRAEAAPLEPSSAPSETDTLPRRRGRPRKLVQNDGLFPPTAALEREPAPS